MNATYFKTLATMMALAVLTTATFAASINAPARARVVKREIPLRVELITPADFGLFAVGTGGGSINLLGTTTGAISNYGGQVPMEVQYSGEPNAFFTYSIPATDLTNLAGDIMTTGPIGSSTYALDPTGTFSMMYDDIKLFASSNQPVGSYAGVMVLTADY